MVMVIVIVTVMVKVLEIIIILKKYQTLDIDFLVIWLVFYSRYKSYIL